jgi:SET domain-containing protein
MNHSCEPNCDLDQWAIARLPRMCYFANEDIKSGKELMFDYNWELKAVSKEMFENSAMKCKCGKPKCLKYIERMKLPKNAGHAVKRARTL